MPDVLLFIIQYLPFHHGLQLLVVELGKLYRCVEVELGGRQQTNLLKDVAHKEPCHDISTASSSMVVVAVVVLVVVMAGGGGALPDRTSLAFVRAAIVRR